MSLHRRPGPPVLRPLRSLLRDGHRRRPSAALPTPPDDVFPDGGLFLDLRRVAEMSRAPREDMGAVSPSDSYPQMTLAEKVREVNYALVHHWGRFLAGAVISELVDHATAQAPHAPRAISAMDLPTNFCISPADELLCPSDDPMRVIVVVSAAGHIVDTGIFDLDGPLFYRGCVVDNHYMSTPLPPQALPSPP
ncbi:hypothetical protein LPJ61_001994 [Coemansia biformis]|uniref:Uncharacterized protein n=1 Tax=Coemansia biformis TaxID=1286918 RepID=A0A9W7Y933_9FUNG|nr:hypothetical protein LPJ61_001994 [Coemansia biformis]